MIAFVVMVGDVQLQNGPAMGIPPIGLHYLARLTNHRP